MRNFFAGRIITIVSGGCMEFVAIFALSAITAIFYLWLQPKIFGLASLSNLQKNYFGKALMTTVVIFAAIVVAGIIFTALDRKVTV
jgi:hypothetical protein